MEIRLMVNEQMKHVSLPGELLGDAAAARRFHRSLPGFAETRLVGLSGLARQLAVKGVFVKDESSRLGLKAFKGLGASYAIARLLAERLGLDQSSLTFTRLASAVRERLPQLTLVTATDGNHGKAVAWMAQQLGLRAVVYLPQGAAAERVQAITALGAEAVVTDMVYDDAVRHAARMAEDHGWLLIQDTAWPGYELIPAWITVGYSTMAAEALEQLQQQADLRPTHVMLQAGVGSMAAGVASFILAQGMGAGITLLEPTSAACYYESLQAGDGQPHRASGDLVTIMAGLSCGEPNPQAWALLRNAVHSFASCSDEVAALGMRALAHPLPGDSPVVSGESGAIGAGFLAALQRPQFTHLREQLGLNGESVILLFSTEGDTDPANYQRIVRQKG